MADRPADASVVPTRASRVRALDESLLSSCRAGDAGVAAEIAAGEASVENGFAAQLKSVGGEIAANSLRRGIAGASSAAVVALAQRVSELERELVVTKTASSRIQSQAAALVRENQRLAGDLAAAIADRASASNTAAQSLGESRAAAIRAEARAARALADASDRAAEDDAAARHTVAEAIRAVRDSASADPNLPPLDIADAQARALREVAALLECERRTGREARNALALERKLRTAAERLLRDAIVDAEFALAGRRTGVLTGAAAVDADGRAHVLADILKEESVLRALPAVVFPGPSLAESTPASRSR